MMPLSRMPRFDGHCRAVLVLNSLRFLRALCDSAVQIIARIRLKAGSSPITHLFNFCKLHKNIDFDVDYY